MSIILGLSVFFAGKNGRISDKEVDKIEIKKGKRKSITDDLKFILLNVRK
jgi:hypothetical protein